MTNISYMTLEVDINSNEDMNQLNILGSQGWIAFHVTEKIDDYIYHMMRYNDYYTNIKVDSNVIQDYYNDFCTGCREGEC